MRKREREKQPGDPSQPQPATSDHFGNQPGNQSGDKALADAMMLQAMAQMQGVGGGADVVDVLLKEINQVQNKTS